MAKHWATFGPSALGSIYCSWATISEFIRKDRAPSLKPSSFVALADLDKYIVLFKL